MKLLALKRKTTLVFAYIQLENNSVITEWFFACNSNSDIIEHLKSNKINCSNYDYMED